MEKELKREHEEERDTPVWALSVPARRGQRRVADQLENVRGGIGWILEGNTMEQAVSSLICRSLSLLAPLALMVLVVALLVACGDHDAGLSSAEVQEIGAADSLPRIVDVR